MDLLYVMRDLGVVPPVAGDAGDDRIRAALASEIERAERGASANDLWPLARRHTSQAWLKGRRRVAGITGIAALVATTGVAAAAGFAPWSLLSTGSAGNLFKANPSQVWSQSGMAPIASSVINLGSISVPGVGAFQYWGGQTQNGEWCMALKAPDGLWAGVAADATGQADSHYNFNGSVPGCGAYSNEPQGDGFHWSVDEIGPTIPGNRTATINSLSAVIFGAIDNPGAASSVINATTGTSAPILNGHYFALVEPRSSLGTIQLKAVDTTGDVIARADPSSP